MTLNALELKLPPLPLACVLALLMWLVAGGNIQWQALTLLHWTAAALLAGAGALFCGLGVARFRGSRTTVNPLLPLTASKLVTGGIYRVSRNPMYVGFFLLLLGWATLLWSLPALLLAIFFVPWMNRFQIGPEERALQSLFGDAYRQYCARVRRWL